MEKASPLAQHSDESTNAETVRHERSLHSVKRQRVDADPKNTAPMFEVANVKEPNFYDQVFGKSPDEKRYGSVDRQLYTLASAKAGNWGHDWPKAPEKIVPWRPAVAASMAMAQANQTMKRVPEKGEGNDAEDAEEDDDPTGGAANFVAPCPLESTLHPDTCQTFITGQHPAVPEPVKCPAIQKHCGKGSGSEMMSLVCRGSCCPVCWAPDHVISLDRHSAIKNEDVIPPHPAAPASCAGAKCFTPLCLPGYEAGHSPGACCASCKIAR